MSKISKSTIKAFKMYVLQEYGDDISRLFNIQIKHKNINSYNFLYDTLDEVIKSTQPNNNVPNPGITDAYVKFREELKNDTYNFSPAPGTISSK